MEVGFVMNKVALFTLLTAIAGYLLLLSSPSLCHVVFVSICNASTRAMEAIGSGRTQIYRFGLTASFSTATNVL